MYSTTLSASYILANTQLTLLVLLFDFSTIRTLCSSTKTEEYFHATMNFALRKFLKTNASFLGNPDRETLIKDNGAESLQLILVSDRRFM
jgi:hypothetical protein